MSSKQVIDNKKSADYVAAAASAHADTIGRALSDLCSPHLDASESLPDAALLSRLLGRALAASSAAMVRADEAHSGELSDDAQPRAERDRVASELVAKLVELREITTGVYGSQLAARLFPGSTPRDPSMLAAFAKEVSHALRTVSLPAPRVKGASIDAATIAKELDAAHAELTSHQHDVVRETREAQATLEAKNTAVASYQQRFSHVANLLSALLSIAGNAELAKKVRPSGRRPGQTAEQAENEGPAAGVDVEERAGAEPTGAVS